MRKQWKQTVAWMVAGGVLLTSLSTPYEVKAQVRQGNAYTAGMDFSTAETSTVASEISTEDASTEDGSTEDYGSRDAEDVMWNLDGDSEATEEDAGTTESTDEISTETEEPAVDGYYTSGDFLYTIDYSTGEATIYKYEGSSSTVEIPSELDGHTVWKIGNGAFSGNTKIRKVVIPATVRKIGDDNESYAFSDCKNLATVEIQAGTQRATIGVKSFQNCTALREITIPGNYQIIYNNAFEGCTALKKVTYEASGSETANQMIMYQAFLNCNNLSEIYLPTTLKSIGQNAFAGTSVVNLVIPEGVESIGSQAFSGCSKLVSLRIPSTVTSIESGAFSNCKKLRSVSMLEGTQSASLGASAFSGCLALPEITIPGNYTEICSGAFSGCTSLQKMNYCENKENNAQLISYSAFSQCTNLIEVKLPSTLQTIYNSAFYGIGATEISIPEGVEEIRSGAFSSCKKLKKVTLPSSLTKLGYESEYSELGVFEADSALETVVMREGNENVAYIGMRSFKDCVGLKNITIPGNYEAVYKSAFEGCTALKSMTWKASDSSYANQIIGERGFYNCTALETVNLPATVAQIGENAFNNSAVTKIIMPEGIETIGSGAFGNCKKLVTVSIPSTVTQIGDADLSGNGGAFADCTNLKYLTIKTGEDDAYIGYATFENCTSLKSVIIPKNYVQVSRKAFEGCSRLKSVYIEDSGMSYTNQQLDSEAFRNCTSLQYLFLPQTVGTINDDQWYIEKLTIFGKEGSYAESYAASRGIPFNANYGSKPVVKKITLSKTTASLNIGKTVTLTAKLTPDYTVYQNVTWTSSNTKVARVNQNGTVTGVSKGTAIITCTSTDGRNIKSTCKVSVANVVTVKSVKLSKTSATLTTGKTVTLKATVAPTNATNKAVTWKSSNPWVATVSSTGKVTARYSGTTTITCTAKDGSGKKATCKITVYSNTEAFVARIYTKALNRNPEPAGLEYWSREINAGRKTPDEVAQLFFSSPEFVNKHLTNTEYVKVLYRTFMGREYDTDGLHYWVNRLNQGESRKSVLKSFAGCPEFRKIVSSFGL